jgi:hypothetical protein
MLCYMLADHLQTPVDQIKALPIKQVREWFAFLKWKNSKAKK